MYKPNSREYFGAKLDTSKSPFSTLSVQTENRPQENTTNIGFFCNFENRFFWRLIRYKDPREWSVERCLAPVQP